MLSEPAKPEESSSCAETREDAADGPTLLALELASDEKAVDAGLGAMFEGGEGVEAEVGEAGASPLARVRKEVAEEGGGVVVCAAWLAEASKEGSQDWWLSFSGVSSVCDHVGLVEAMLKLHKSKL